MKQRLMFAALTLLIILILVACAPPSGQNQSTPQLTAPAARATDTPAGTAAPDHTPEKEVTKAELPAGAVIMLAREGGFAGVMEQWTVYEDGRVVDQDGNDFAVPPEAVQPLLQTLTFLPAEVRDASFVPQDTCCDRFLYTLAFRQGERVVTIRALEGEENVPAAVWAAVAAVQALLDSAAQP